MPRWFDWYDETLTDACISREGLDLGRHLAFARRRIHNRRRLLRLKLPLFTRFSNSVTHQVKRDLVVSAWIRMHLTSH